MKKKIIWQDLVLMIGGFCFTPPLIIMILNGVKLPIFSSLSTAVILMIFVICMYTLKLKLAALANSLSSACWFILFFMAL